MSDLFCQVVSYETHIGIFNKYSLVVYVLHNQKMPDGLVSLYDID